MSNVICSCAKCSSELGCFRNSWTGIGNSYFSPVYPPVTYINGFEPTGEVFAKGPDGSAVQNSVLQDLACRKCAKVLGLICNDVPSGHLLKKNQLILRLAEMHVVSEHTGEKATLSIQQKIPLVAPGIAKKYPANRRAATLQPMPRQQTPSKMVREGAASSVSGSMPPARDVSGKEVAISNWAGEAIKSQQKDIDRISGTVSRIERDMASFKDFMIEVRAELEANRITRKTQYKSNQEQLVWLQEDLKELRQESGDFQQDLREEKLPDVRNQLVQLRQEIATHQPTGLPKNSILPAAVDDFKIELVGIRRKAIEVDQLKVELHRLQKRLDDMEGKRLRTSNQFSQFGINSKPLAYQQRPQIMLQASEHDSAPSATNRQASPTRNPPGSFPDSLVDLMTPPKLIHPVTNAAVSTRAQSLRSRGGVEVAGTASPSSLKWSYTKTRRWQSVKVAFDAFGLEYPKLGVPDSIGVLQDHVNNSSLQNTAVALRYGRVTVNDEDVDIGSSELVRPEPFQLKRKHHQLEAHASDLASDGLPRKRRQAGKTADVEKELDTFDETSISSSTDISEGPVPSSVPFARGSPELRPDSRLRSLGGSPGHPQTTKDGQPSENGYEGVGNIDGSASQTRLDSSYQQARAQTVHQRQISQDEPDEAPPAVHQSTTVSKNKNTISDAATNSQMRSIEGQTSIPGAFPRDIVIADAATPTSSGTTPRPLIVTGFDPRSDKTKHFKCGPCGKKYRNPGAFKYHKKHSSCNDDPSDKTPSKFKCPFCGTHLSWSGLEWHLGNVDCSDKMSKEGEETPTVDKGHKQKYMPAVNQNNDQTLIAEQKRTEVMAARERLVKETLEREN